MPDPKPRAALGSIQNNVTTEGVSYKKRPVALFSLTLGHEAQSIFYEVSTICPTHSATHQAPFNREN